MFRGLFQGDVSLLDLGEHPNAAGLRWSKAHGSMQKSPKSLELSLR